MPQRTITNAGGTFSLTATWVEGAVPTSADFVVGSSTSGPLIVAAGTTIQYIDFTQYQNTLTINNGITLTANLSGGSTTFSATMSFNFVGTGRIGIDSNHSLGQLGTQRIPTLRIASGTKTLNTDIYVTNLIYGNAGNVVNGNNMFIFGDYLQSAQTQESDGWVGTTVHHLNGTGIATVLYGSNAVGATSAVIINGTYSSFYGFLRMNNRTSLTIATTSNCSNLNVYLEENAPVGGTGETYEINTYSKINNLVIESQTNAITLPDRFITMNTTLLADRILVYSLARVFTSDVTVPNVRFSGAGISASQLYISPIISLPSSGSFPYVYTYKSNNIFLQPGVTNSFGNVYLQGAEGNNSFVTASSAGTVTLRVQNGSDSSIANYNFTNINASSGQKLYALNGTLINTTNIDTTIPTGGTGGTAAGPYAFASIT